MIDFACVSSTTPTWSNDPRWCTPGIAATEAEQGRAAQRKKARQEAAADEEEEDQERPSKSGGVAASTATGGKAHDSPAPTEDDEDT
eukprot:jgi/Tetstr1/437279/TSEL_026008.t1